MHTFGGVQPMLLAVGILLAWRNIAFASGSRTIEFQFTPTTHVQLAMWIESVDGTFLRTVGLTQSVSTRGIGNRPGASQMNSGYRFPYGRRENVLPVWAHRRAAAPGALSFQRIIFQNRASEGYASRTTADSSPDSYFCLSFAEKTNMNANSTRDTALDAITCPTAFNSDKGRLTFATAVDLYYGSGPVAAGLVGRSDVVRAMVRHLLAPVVAVAQAGIFAGRN